MRTNPHDDREGSDINIRGVVSGAIALALVALIAVGIVTGLLVYLRRAMNQAQGPASSVPQEVILPAEPRIERDTEGDLREMREQENRILDDYRWVDKDAGVARIPIDRAMKVALERGLLTPKAPAAGPPKTSNRQRATSPKSGVARSEGAAAASLASEGEKKFRDLNCGNCHLPGGNGRGPALEGVFGKTEMLEGGTMVQVDEDYLRESIMMSAAKLVAGYLPIMPSYQAVISDEELTQLIEYIKTLR